MPGHVWQEALGVEKRLWHPIRGLVKFNVYSEGWGLYAEQLMDELGLHDDDVAGRLGFLQAQQLRASRLVVDTGLHAKGWSREQAIVRMVQTTGRPRDAMQGEVDRYCVKPGQACGYEIGRAQIVKIRDGAQRARGAAFVLKDFNDCVLTTGNVPIEVLAEAVGHRFAPEATSP